MNKKQKTNWWIDLVLFASFLITFFLDITGLTAHQWIGIVSIALATIHFMLHLEWVKTIAKKFFHKRFGKARLNFMMDLSILFGFILIGFTGVVMSTLLNLPLPNYDTWRQLHITSSMMTLVLIMVKIGLHLRWIEQTTRKMLAGALRIPANNLVPHAPSKRLGRREFLISMGMVGTASIIALASASKSLAESLSNDELANATLTQTPTSTEPPTEAATVPPEAIPESKTTADMATQTPTVTATPITATTAVESTCTVRCSRGCTYPGHCRRYTDANANGLCDLGECL